MDILEEIAKQVEAIKSEDTSAYLDSILVHLTRADYYYQNGSSDQQYFNDVIYRSNQAFEGALKEAYKVLANKTDDELRKESPYSIGKHLKDNSIFKDRVLTLFDNYRQEWRNKSTHDYKLVFDDSEAFIALVSVSSFVHLLLKQIQEQVAYNKEQKKNAGQSVEKILLKEIIVSPNESLLSKITKIIGEFARDNELLHHELQVDEHSLLGVLHAYLDGVDNGLVVLREPKLDIGSRMLRPDFILEYNGDKVVMEVKRFIAVNSIDLGIKQLSDYLSASNINKGILYFTSASSASNDKPVLSVEKRNVIVKDDSYEILVVST